jgi:glycosyltransferase involved in cell wall biosynthesis
MTVRLLYHAPLDVSLPLGHAVHVRHLVDALEARGYRVRLVTREPSFPLSWPWPSGGAVLIPSYAIPHFGFARTEGIACHILRKEYKEWRPDLFIVRQELLTTSPLLARSPMPMIVESNCHLAAMARIAGAPAWRVDVVRGMEGSLLSRASRIAAVSEELRRVLAAAYGVERIDVVPNGTWVPPLSTTEEIEEARASAGVGPRTFVAAFIGNLNRLQGIPLLIESVSRLDDSPFVLWIIGDGAEADALRNLAEKAAVASRSIGRIRFLGALPEEDAARYAQAAQVLLAPYTPETLTGYAGDPLKVLTAFASDRPLLTGAALEGLPPEIVSGACCRRLPPGEPLAWTEALQELMQAWEDAGSPLADWPWPRGEGGGRAYVRSARTWDHTARAWERVFARVLR